MPSERDILSRKFWPRNESELSELEIDQSCLHCGYDLRGLRGNRCPECGKTFERFPWGGAGIPWSRRAVLGWMEAFWHTVWLASFHPARLAGDALSARDLGLSDARRFRFTVTGIAWASFLALWLMINPWNVEGRAWPISVPIAAAGIGIWLVLLTRIPVVVFSRQTMAQARHERVIALGHFVCGSYALTPIHLISAGITVALRDTADANLIIALGHHALLISLAGHVLLWLYDYAAILRRTMDVKAVELIVVTTSMLMATTAWTMAVLALMRLALYLLT